VILELFARSDAKISFAWRSRTGFSSGWLGFLGGEEEEEVIPDLDVFFLLLFEIGDVAYVTFNAGAEEVVDNGIVFVNLIEPPLLVPADIDVLIAAAAASKAISFLNAATKFLQQHNVLVQEQILYMSIELLLKHSFPL
jgi:hypothetical protein